MARSDLLSIRIREMNIQARIEAFLRGSASVMGLVGQTGSGKLRAAERAAIAAGFQTTVLDRTQGNINYSRLGACALCQDGLTRTVTIVCGADSETAPPNPKSLPKGAKIILIGNSCCAELERGAPAGTAKSAPRRRNAPSVPTQLS